MINKFNKIVLTAILCCVAVMPSVAQSDDTKKDPPKNIPVISTPPDERHHRSLVSEVEAYYQDDTIYIVFNKLMGNAAINVYNFTTGRQRNVECYTGLGTVSIDISNMGDGDYYLEIATSHGDWYYAYFSI